MRIINNIHIYYIVAKEENDKIMYLTTDDTFTDDIYGAAKAANRITAKCLIDAYKESKWWSKEISTEEYEDKDFNFGLKIIPIQVIL